MCWTWWARRNANYLHATSSCHGRPQYGLGLLYTYKLYIYSCFGKDACYFSEYGNRVERLIGVCWVCLNSCASWRHLFKFPSPHAFHRIRTLLLWRWARRTWSCKKTILWCADPCPSSQSLQATTAPSRTLWTRGEWEEAKLCSTWVHVCCSRLLSLGSCKRKKKKRMYRNVDVCIWSHVFSCAGCNGKYLWVSRS